MSGESAGAAELSALLARAAGGDRLAFRDFYDRMSAKLFGVILRIVSERGEAEDVLQEVFVTIWRKAAEYDPSRASPVTWTATIARNRAIDRLRARGSRPSAPIEDAADVRDHSPAADTLIDADSSIVAINRALATLEPRHAAAIRSCYFEGMTYEALAARENVPVGTLKSWVRRGLVRLKTELDGRGLEPSA